MHNIKTVTVVGANGTMGTNIAGIFASFGNAEVYLISRSLEASKKAAQRAVKSVRAGSIFSRLKPMDYSALEQCVRASDLVFECVAEDLKVKKEITGKIAAALQEDTLVCSGTSGLSITTLAQCLPEHLRKNYFGVHLFNPPYNLTLCELIPSPEASPTLTAELRQYLTDVLRRTVVEVKDAPAFLGNRIGFQFINRALCFAEKYKDSGGIDYVDAILGPFTGRSMPPLLTANFVGLDVHKAIVDNLYQHTNDYAHETFCLPSYVQKLIDDGKLGRKAGAGLYQTVPQSDGMKQILVYDIASGFYREKISYQFPFAQTMISHLRTGDYSSAFRALLYNHSEEAALCVSFLLHYILYALETARNVGDSLHAADDVMATGFNWCPPLAMIEALSTVMDFGALMEERLGGEVPQNVDLQALLEAAPASKYDYRLFFKSKQ